MEPLDPPPPHQPQEIPPPSHPQTISLPGQPEPPTPPTRVVVPEPESRLDQLAARYALRKPQLDKLADEVEEITKAIKTEMRSAHPDSENMLLTSPHLTKPLPLKAVLSWRLDSTKLKAAHPVIWATFAKRVTSWTLGGR